MMDLSFIDVMMQENSSRKTLTENGAVAYAPGATYTAEEAVTLYAVWEINTYTVTYDANGGENAPAGQVKTHFEALTHEQINLINNKK